MPRFFFAATLLAFLASPALARDPEWGGLGAVAASPDGKTVVCGGENRALYVLDAATREVKQRLWAQARVGGMGFSKDGAHFTFEDDDEVLHVYDTATWKETAKVADAAECAWAPAADLAVGISYKNKGIVFVSLSDGSEKGRAAIDGKILAIGIDASGGKVAVLMEAAVDAEEKRSTRRRCRKTSKAPRARSGSRRTTARWRS